MSIVPFNTRVRQQLLDNGYTHIEFRHFMKNNETANGKDTHILKALERTDTLPPTAKFEDIQSEKVNNLLLDTGTNSFIIIK
jgi:hypothetical protein